MQIDRTDKRILEALQRNGRISNLDLADEVGLSPTPCARRVKALEEAGIIRGYFAQLEADRLNLKLLAMVHVSMDRHTPERFEGFERAMSISDHVLECFLITGQSADYIVKVIVEDMDDYQHFLLNTLTRIEGVSGVHSSFVLRKVIERHQLPVKPR